MKNPGMHVRGTGCPVEPVFWNRSDGSSDEHESPGPLGVALWVCPPLAGKARRGRVSLSGGSPVPRLMVSFTLC
jgi:hypothetical protein